MSVTQKRHLCGFIALIACGVGTHVQASVVEKREFDSKALSRKWSYMVYLPDGYETSTQRYPVFYLLHGNSQNMSSWSTQGRIQPTTDELIASKQIPATIIVMPDAGTTWYVDRKENMETAFIEDLMPHVEANFRTVAARNGRLIGGLSMGGYGSLRFVLKYPEKFAAVALLSPAIYDTEPPENSSARSVGVFGAPNYDGAIWKQYSYPALLDAYFAKNQPVPMYINSGDDDNFMIEAEATELYSLLRRKRQPAELRIVDGAHNWTVWSNTIGDAMKYIYRYVTPAVPEAAQPDKR